MNFLLVVLVEFTSKSIDVFLLFVHLSSLLNRKDLQNINSFIIHIVVYEYSQKTES